MELDKRIKEGKRPLTCFDLKEAEKFRGEDGYFAHEMEVFENLDRCYFSRLLGFDTCDKSIPFAVANASRDYEFFIPENWVLPAEKKYRPFKDHTEYKEYLNDGIIESWIQIREKLTGEVSELMYVGGSGAIICLGAYSFDLNQMFYDFELFNESTGEWQPFGVLDE